ncbi:TadE/TadG family type IV pilus assembly protein [Pseudomonas sp. BN102]|uniref:TadE/TadG family type IV pilus assembly protein n=1 Tax=Pseudomonas sp. BN102 TaxID=2567886 RepID=UPI002457B334|nr:TadE/TadG family type IV pilus assembly protein [Pseudomonas sp. BN102]MDH4607274.1 pilus assembly protein [Pseudomonas sp. BN102]
MARLAFSKARAQRGVAMVEFTITLPLLLLLLFAIAEFGRLLFQYNSLLQANRDAVRYVAGKAWNPTLGTVELSTTLQAATKNLAVYGVPVAPANGQALVPGLTTTNVQVTAVGTTHVQVSTSFTFVPVLGGGIPGFIGNGVSFGFPLVATTVMRVL